MRSIVLLVTLVGSAAYAQDLTGNWQGTLQAGKELRIVVTISKGDGTGLKAMMYSIDQGGQGISAATFALLGTTVRMSISGIGSTFEGKLSEDGNSIAETWRREVGRCR